MYRILQGSPATFLLPTDPFPYLGVLYTMDLDWSHQLARKTSSLREKLLNLEPSYLPYRHALKVIKSAVIPSLAYSFPVVPCTEADLAGWDGLILNTIRKKLRLMKCTARALLHEDANKFGLACTSVAVEYHSRNAAALTACSNSHPDPKGQVHLDAVKSHLRFLDSLMCGMKLGSLPSKTRLLLHLRYLTHGRQILLARMSDLLLRTSKTDTTLTCQHEQLILDTLQKSQLTTPI